ncbi:hypothetical protein BPT24_296 [Tenacibaculum phage pT24]|uniref:Lipoprotein n=1 Tax=Tenacibaculum phage pT24 TaxID=1880590 RepID=A0A1B4XX76_9CAUD|nr:hypothetical protein HYP10_gp231 [Tenacibaculum phage pT24]BAV39414.1 hypothetical protein BPT24_296 [Tenacibaculum phage pT24]
MKKIKNVVLGSLLLFAVALGMQSCTDASRASLGSYGSEFEITMYSGGNVVGKWTSTGRVSTEESSDGYKFKDKETGKFVRVTGDLTIIEK